MAKIKHFFRDEKVYEECNDRGVTFKDWVNKKVEHYVCSDCNAEVPKNSAFCCKCGTKFSGIEEFYKTTACHVCGTKFKQLDHKTDTCCTRCLGIIEKNYYDKEDLAKAFFNLGKNLQSKKLNRGD